jgi:uncharacterized protein (TIGR02099 family)
MLKKSLLRFYQAAFDIIGFLTVAFLLAIVVTQYYFLPRVDQYRESIETKLTETIGQKVSIGEIYAKWDGINPHLTIFNLKTYDKDNQEVLNLEHVEATFSWTSLLTWSPRMSSIEILRPDLTIHRETDGTVYVAGISMNGPSRPDFPNWLLKQANFTVRDADIIWQDDYRNAPTLELNHLDLHLNNPVWDQIRGAHRFRLVATPSTGSSKPIDIRGHVFGRDVSHLESWHGTLYAKIEETDMTVWKKWVDYPIDLIQGEGLAQFWMEFANHRVTQLTGDLALDNLVAKLSYRGLKEQDGTRFNHLSGRVKWTQLDHGTQIEGENLNLTTSDNLSLHQGSFSIIDQTNSKHHIVNGQIKLGDIKLDTLSHFLGYFETSSELENAMTATNPSGKLANLLLTWNWEDDNLTHYALNTQFNHLTLNPYTPFHIPGFSNLSGALKMDEAKGQVNLNAQNATFTFPGILRWPVPADSIAGQLSWSFKNNDFNLDITRVDVISPHFKGEAHGKYLGKNGSSGFIDIVAHVRDVDVKNGRFYYPLTISNDTRNWLDTSLLSGHGDQADLILRGPLNEFPWPQNKDGLFKVTGKATHAVIDHSDGWPKLEDVNLDLLFEGKRMEINVNAGHALGNIIKKAKVIIPDLTADENVLDVIGEAQGPLLEGVKYINNSPIKKLANGFTDDLKATGTAKLNLNLHIPLSHLDNTKFKGSYEINNGTLTTSGVPELSKLNGPITFTESSLTVSNMSCSIYGGPANFSVSTDKNRVVVVNAKGHLIDAGLKKAFGGLFPEGLSGGSDWIAKAQISNKLSDVIIRSNLVGLSSSLPAPLTKDANDPLQLLIERKQTNANQDTVKLNLGNIVNAKLLRSIQNGNTKIDRGEVAISTPLENTIPKGLYLHGNFDTFNLDAWSNQFNKNGNSNSDSSVPFNHVEITANRMDAFGRRINEVKLNLVPMDTNWLINLKSNEVTGDIRWNPDGNGKISATLSNFIYPELAPVSIKNSDTSSTANNKKYPALDITAESFEFNRKKFGHMELQAKEQLGNWGIDKLKFTSPEGTLTANGEWNNWKSKPNTQIRFNWEISDLGKMLKRLNYGDLISGGSAELSGQLRWPGSPSEFDYPNLSGNMKLYAKKGVVLKVEPGVGRLFSVLSLQKLPQRFTLDFKDLFSSGFPFDEISGDVSITKGIMHSDNFKMDGAAAKVEIKGDTDLDKEALHLSVKATPKLSDTFALSTCAGGPAVCLSVFIAQKILKDPLNKLAQTEYKIGGTWSDPKDESSKESAGDKKPILPLGQ